MPPKWRLSIAAMSNVCLFVCLCVYLSVCRNCCWCTYCSCRLEACTQCVGSPNDPHPQPFVYSLSLTPYQPLRFFSKIFSNPTPPCPNPTPPADWRRQLGHPRITWLSTVKQDLKHHHLTLPEAADLAQNCPLWRMMSTYGATQS